MPFRSCLRAGLVVLATALAACQSSPSTPVDAPPSTPRYGLLATVEAVPATPTVLVMGGSEVGGWASQLIVPGAQIRSIGLPGGTVAAVRQSLLPQALAARPAVAVVAVGGQDLLDGVAQEDFKRDLNAIAFYLKESGTKVYLVDLPRLDEYPALSAQSRLLDQRVDLLHNALRCVVRDQDAFYIDMRDWTRALKRNSGLVEADGRTPTAEAQGLWARLIADEIELPGTERGSRR